MGDQELPARLLDLARRARAPEALSDRGLRARFGDPADVVVQVGQVWRAHWEEASVLLLILAVEDRDVLAAPVTIDPPAEDEHCIVVEGSSTAFAADGTVWADMAAAVPVRVLERAVDQWDKVIVGWVRQWMEGKGADVSQGVRPGQPAPSEFAAPALMRTELADDVDVLVYAPGLPAAVSGQTQQDLATRLRGNIDLATLCDELGLPQPEVMRILRGKALLSADQMVTVARVTGLTAEQVAQSILPLPLALVLRAEHPRWRAAWQRRARLHGTTEAEARLTGAYGAYALAARQTGASEPDWDQRLREFLRDGADLS